MPKLRVRDLEMHYELHGRPDAEPLVLLHGFTGTGENFDPFLAPLTERYRLIVPDWRGHGRTTNPADTIVHAELARDTAAFVTALGIERAHFLGFSSGGMHLLFLALEQPQLIQSLTLASATYTFDEHVKALVPEVRASASPGWVESIEAETRETHGAGYAQTLLDLWVASVLRENELPFTPDDLKRIACWTLILHGDRDQFFPVRIPVTMYQAIPNAELGIAPGHGHTSGYLPLFMPALLNFLGQHPIVQSTA
jgi:pimeloyl-ACP methyl ester carboxylesterase